MHSMYAHILNTIADPKQGEKLPSQGEPGIQPNCKAIRLLQAAQRQQTPQGMTK